LQKLCDKAQHFLDETQKEREEILEKIKKEHNRIKIYLEARGLIG
jgi:hypothetical protein